jgi:hypothetical protein
MKKQTYMKPAMRLVQLRHRTHLLNASPDGYDSKPMQMRGGEGNQITSEEDVY